MIRKVIEFSARNRALVLLAVAMLCVVAVAILGTIRLDAAFYPEPVLGSGGGAAERTRRRRLPEVPRRRYRGTPQQKGSHLLRLQPLSRM